MKNCAKGECEKRMLQETADRQRRALERVAARASAVPSDDEAELRRQMFHIKSLAGDALKA